MTWTADVFEFRVSPDIDACRRAGRAWAQATIDLFTACVYIRWHEQIDSQSRTIDHRRLAVRTRARARAFAGLFGRAYNVLTLGLKF